MIFPALPESRDPRVVLRPLEATDLPAWYAYLSQPRVYEHTSWNLSGVDDLAPVVTAMAFPTPDSPLRLAICTRGDGILAGTIGFHSVYWPDRRAEIAYDLAPGFWGQGIATAMVNLMTAWAHADVGLQRVQATVLTSNARSQAVIARCGFEFEGILRQYRMVRGQPGDFAMYAHRILPARPA